MTKLLFDEIRKAASPPPTKQKKPVGDPTTDPDNPKSKNETDKDELDDLGTGFDASDDVTGDEQDDENGDSMSHDASRNSRVTKTEDVDLAMTFQILKIDEEQQVVYGFASVSAYNGAEVTDLQDDVIDMAEVTKAAHDFMMNSRSGGNMHDRMDTGVIVESLLLDRVMKDMLGVTRPEEGWLIGYKATDSETWADVKAGRFRGFSIGGTGVRTPVP